MSDIFSYNFNKAFSKLLELEGMYSNISVDPGGETIYGISREYHPEWEGWYYLDSIKSADLKDLDKNKQLLFLAKKFYFEKYWQKLKLDEIEDFNLQFELFEMSVNIGVRTAAIILQRALNLLNYAGQLYKPLMIDGIIGRKTIKSIKTLLNHDETSEYLIKYINILQGYYYVRCIERNRRLSIFARGWLRRIKV